MTKKYSITCVQKSNKKMSINIFKVLFFILGGFIGILFSVRLRFYLNIIFFSLNFLLISVNANNARPWFGSNPKKYFI